MNRTLLQQLCRIRLKEARILLKNKCYDGAYYLSGYAIELALKSCIAKKINKYDFPNKELANRAYDHNIEKLIKVAGIESDLENEILRSSQFNIFWNVIKEWDVVSRYEKVDSKKSKSLYDAIVNQKNGVLKWIRQRW